MNERLTTHENHDVTTCMSNYRNEQSQQQTVLTKQRTSSNGNQTVEQDILENWIAKAE